ncbi:hypothetical protein C7T94_12495 [Pedobacter yulinensis]|uniref:Peptidase S8 n=1 Tax=Pedobacter yulinensis TaxID=2126353 RepID=A0A2T3HLP8_9SPHI|nr:S8 family serine peptidase [Pedobacter yulinensis]PST83388.1 hypothetical protein C7T94_12495 [Pedobacter yulinensis]
MKKILFILLCCSIECLAQVAPVQKRRFVLPAGVTDQHYLPNTVIVKFRQEPKVNGIAVSQGNMTLGKGRIMSVRQPFASAARLPQTAAVPAGLDKIYELKLSAQADVVASINELLTDQNVVYAEPSYIYRTGYTPNDPGVAQSPYLSQVRAPQAWDLLTQASGVVIAIVDSGSETSHPDLAPNLFLNTADPVNGVDDDGDGFTDNYYGWDFAGASTNNPVTDNDPNVKSRNSQHGIHVSGLASAVSNNGLGVASIAGSAKLMIIKAGPDDNATLISKGYEGIKYAADHGAQIINCSWSGPVGGAYGRDVVNYALARGCLIVAAAGNSNAEQPEYPAAYEGVLAVADVNGTDAKSGTSNYGRHIGIAAPGTSIYSTMYDKSYGFLSGTSMSTPIVTSAAALVKTHRPAYDARQIGELLRVTADPIFNGTNYSEKMGSGRLNVFRAMTENPASVRIAALRATNPFGNYRAGDTLRLFVDLKNFLIPVTGLSVRLSTTNPSVRIRNPEISVGNMATGAIRTATEPFSIDVLPGISDNEVVEFRLSLNGNGGVYQDYAYFNQTFALDYLNYRVNEISTTLTSNGRIGFKENTSNIGQGFRYKDQNLLFEASLMIGTESGKLANNVRATDLTADEDFVKRTAAKLVSNDARLFEASASFDDRDAPNRPGVVVENRHIAFKDTERAKAVIVNYEVSNPGTAGLQGLYLGLFTDWDFGDGTGELARYDKATKTAFFEAKTGKHPYVGIKLLNRSFRALYTPLSASLAGNALTDRSFTASEKLQLLLSGVSSDGLGQNVNGNADVCFVTGYGPVSIAAGAKQVFSFAIIAGDSQEEITQTAAALAQAYPVPGDAGTENALVLKQNYPNPVSNLTTIEFNLPEGGQTELAVFDTQGKRMAVIASGLLEAGSHQFDYKPGGLAPGIYIYRLTTGYGSKSAKMIIMP